MTVPLRGRRILPVAVLVAAVSACGGDGTTVRSEIQTTTIGRELIKLKEARDAGTMTRDEYEQARRETLGR